MILSDLCLSAFLCVQFGSWLRLCGVKFIQQDDRFPVNILRRETELFKEDFPRGGGSETVDPQRFPRAARVFLPPLGGGGLDREAGPDPGGQDHGSRRHRSGQWASADVVVAICYLDWTKPRVQELDAFLARGGGFVVVHAATWTRPEPSPQLAELTGVGGFTRWREGPLELELNPEHPICRGLPAKIRLVDEAYWPPTPAPAPGTIEVLAISREADNGGPAVARPLIWTHRRGQGRVFGCVPGHYNWTLDDPLYRLLLLRGIAWSAGESPYRFDLLALERARVAP